MSSQILITGATGFIGRRLTHDLIEQGENVRVLARNRSKARELFRDDAELITGDIRSTDALEKACQGVEVIYHIAGTYRFGLRHRRELWDTNVNGAENLLRAAASAQVEKVVHLSSGGVLRKKAAAVDGSVLLNETDFPSVAPRFCAYKSSKWHSELIALEWSRRGLPVAIANTTCPIGSGDESPTPTGRIVRDFLRRQFPFYCHTGLNFIGVGDLSRGLQQVAESGQSGERYLICDENLWLKEFLDYLAIETGVPAPRTCLPNGLISAIGCAGEVVDLLNPRSTGARVCLETALHARHVQFFSNAKAREELGWKPVASIQENVAEAVRWFRNEPEVAIQPAASSLESHVR